MEELPEPGPTTDLENDPEIGAFIYENSLHKSFSDITGKRSIHDEESIKFYEKSLDCKDKFVLSVLKHGLLLPFSEEVAEYEEENNKSAQINLNFLREKIKKWEEQKYVRRVETKPYCVSPLSVAEKTDLKTQETKKRPCLDLSRHVNKYLQDWPTKLSNLDSSAPLLDPGDWQAACDLENQYFHVRVHPNHQKYLGFKIRDNQGKEEYYVFCVMVYGIKIATAVVTRLIKPIVRYVHQKGIRFSIYIDDGRTIGASQEVTAEHHEIVLRTFEKAGWNIQYSKTSIVPTQHLYYQGFINDSKNMLYYLPQFKKNHLKTELDALIHESENNSPITVRRVARVIGKLVSSIRALGPFIKILLRSAHQMIDAKIQTEGWDSTLVIQENIREDLVQIKNSLDEENGQPIVTSKTGISLNSLIPDSSTRSIGTIKPITLIECEAQPQTTYNILPLIFWFYYLPKIYLCLRL